MKSEVCSAVTYRGPGPGPKKIKKKRLRKKAFKKAEQLLSVLTRYMNKAVGL